MTMGAISMDAITVSLEPRGMAIVDPELEDIVARLSWRLDARTYQRSRAFTWNTKGLLTGFPKRLYLERLVMKAPEGKYVRFLNLNTLDCRRANLEVVKWRKDTFIHDRWQRHQWELQQTLGQEVPQYRRLETWRLWCKGSGLAEIARQLAADKMLIIADLKAMAEDPYGAGQMS